jgi:hypothetical protein
MSRSKRSAEIRENESVTFDSTAWAQSMSDMRLVFENDQSDRVSFAGMGAVAQSNRPAARDRKPQRQ